VRGGTLVAAGFTEQDDGIFLLGRRRPHLLLRSEDSSPLGGLITIPFDAGFVLSQHRVVFTATFEAGATASEAILAVGDDRGRGPS